MKLWDYQDFAQGNLQVLDVNQTFHQMNLKFLTCQGSSRTRN